MSCRAPGRRQNLNAVNLLAIWPARWTTVWPQQECAPNFCQQQGPTLSNGNAGRSLQEAASATCPLKAHACSPLFGSLPYAGGT